MISIIIQGSESSCASQMAPQSLVYLSESCQDLLATSLLPLLCCSG